MFSKKSTEHYVKRVAQEHGITQKAARKILNYGMRNVCLIINKGEDLNLQHFGSFYFDKKAYSSYLQTLKTSEGKSKSKSHNDVGKSKNQ